jgi:hypothetical protein
MLDIGEVRPQPEPLEHGQRGDEGAAIGQVDADPASIQIPQRSHRFRRDDGHLLIVELGHIGELLLDVLGKAFPLEIVERVGAHDAEVDALQEQDVGDALHRAAPDDRQYAQLGAVVEHGGEVGADLHIGAPDRAGDQCHGVGIQRLLGRPRTKLEDGPQTVADL